MSRRLPSPPPVLAGFTHVRPLGVGGFADVFLYEQNMPRRLVAVKVLPVDESDPDLRRMLLDEADVLAALSSHPAIVTVYQAGLLRDGRPYIAMEYCPGVFGQRYRGERISLSEVLTAGVRVAGALETVHRSGLLHRDVKPSNILVNSLGSAVLADFGISSPARSVSQRGVRAMSIPWSAPEIVTELSTGSVASDVWSLGATIYALLGGHSPFERRDPARNTEERMVNRIVRARYAPLSRPDVPRSLQTMLARSMERLPSKRQPSAWAFAQELRAVQLELGLSATPLDVPGEPWRSFALSGATSDATEGASDESGGARRARLSSRSTNAHARSDDDAVASTSLRPRERPAGARRAARRGCGLLLAGGALSALLLAVMVAARYG